MLGKITIMLGCMLSVISLAHGQSSGSHTVSLTLSDITEIRFKPSTSQDLDFSFLDGDDYQNGVENTEAAFLQIQSNNAWKVNVKAGFPNFAYYNAAEPTATAVMPADVVKVRKSGGSYAGLSFFTPTEVASGSAGSYSEIGNEFAVDYLADPGYAYPAGNYFMVIMYTVTAD